MPESTSPESNSVLNYGQMSGVNIGGTRNQASVGAASMTQGGELLAELRVLLSELVKTSPDESQAADIAKVQTAVTHVENGHLDAAKKALAGVGRWVLDVAQRVGATLVTKELEGYFS